MNWHLYLTPRNRGSPAFGLFLGVAAIVRLIMNRRQIGAALARAGQRLFSPVGFFGLVIVVFR